MKVVIKWIAMSLFTILALTAFIDGAIMGGICFGLMAIWVSPPFIPAFEAKTSIRTNKFSRYSVLAGLWVLAVLSFKAKEDKSNAPKIEDSTPIAAIPKETITPLESLEKDYHYFKEEFDVKAFRGSAPQIQGEVIAFGSFATSVLKVKDDTNQQVVKLAAKFKKELVAFQEKEFPIIRKELAEELRKTLWEEDIDVSVQGKRYTVLNLTASSFASNKNIKAAYETIYKQLYNMRFKEVRFRWYDGADEYTFFKTEAPSDSELIELSTLLQ